MYCHSISTWCGSIPQQRKYDGVAPTKTSPRPIGPTDVELEIEQGSKTDNGTKIYFAPGTDGEVDKLESLDFDRQISKTSRTSRTSRASDMSNTSSRIGGKFRQQQRAQEHMDESMEQHTDAIVTMQQKDWIFAGVAAFLAFGTVLILCIWSAYGLLPEEHIGHVHNTKSRTGHVHSPIYSTPALVELEGTEKDIFDVRLIGMSVTDFSHPHSRRLELEESWFYRFPRHLRYRPTAKVITSISTDDRRLNAGSHHETHPSHQSTPTHDAEPSHQDSGSHHETEPSHHDHGSHHETEPSHQVESVHSAQPGHEAAPAHGAEPSHHSETNHNVHSGHPSRMHATEPAPDAETGHEANGPGSAIVETAVERGHGANGHGAAIVDTASHSTHVSPKHGTDGSAGQEHQAHGEDDHGEHHGHWGTLTYRLLADGKEFFQETIALSQTQEVEYFKTVRPYELGYNHGKDYTAEVTAKTGGGDHVAFMLQVVRMNTGADYRFYIGMAIFIVTFASIVAEKVHRSYSAAIGASVVLCCVAAIQETPELHNITGMIEWGTLMLLFSMMILMSMLSMTGFFNWFSIKMIKLSKQDPHRLFFLLTLACGFMSMVLDNVTCVLLTGPLVYQIAKKMELNPRVIYLSMTVCATIGGTATLIGDPPNIVIGMKLKLGFETFLFINFPIVACGLLPLASFLLHHKFKDTLCKYTDKPPVLDIKELEEENRIRNEPMFFELGAVLSAVLLALLLSPVHHIEPAWFTVMAMFACALRFDHHDFGKWLEMVEWDTLYFFALLFVLVEALSELGVIRTLGGAIMSLIGVFPESIRMYAAISIILWVSGLGSAFLESLPYTTTMVYIIQDLMGSPQEGVQVARLIWPLSIGACIGGIGSIMGSSANLVCMAISRKNAIQDDEKVEGTDFIKHGFPTLVVLLVVSNIWLWFMLIWCDFEP